MTTQNNPFPTSQNNSNPSAKKDSTADFSIHTMQDDLTSMQKQALDQLSLNSRDNKEKKPEATSPETKKPVETKNTPPQIPNPFVQTQSPLKQPPLSPIKEKEEEEKKTFPKLATPTTPTTPTPPTPPTPPVAPTPLTPPKTAQPTTPEISKEKVAIYPTPKITNATAPQETSKKSVSRKITGALLLFIFIIIGLAGYYFWITYFSSKTSKPTEIIPEKNSEAILEENPSVTINPQTEKYSSIKPNFLVLDLAKLNEEEIRAEIIKTAEEIRSSSSLEPFEFIVVDANNNPVSFPIFSIAINLNFSQQTLSDLGKDFSLFLFNDNGNMKLGLSTTINNKDSLAKELQAQEKTLPSDISFLFLGLKPETTSNVFKDGTFEDAPTRYLNLNKEETLSVDYALTSNKFLIGTSKNTLRALLTKIKNQPEAKADINDSTTNEIINTSIGTCAEFPEKLNFLFTLHMRNSDYATRNHWCC